MFLCALPLKEHYFLSVREEIERIFDDIIYRPLFRAIKREELLNAMQDDPLYKAIYDGKVWLEDGKFHGTYNSQISRRLKQIGAKYNPASKTWSYSGALPPEVSTALVASAARYTAMRQLVLKTLSDMNIASIDALSNLTNKYEQTITWMNDDFEKTVKSVSIPAKLTDEQRAIIAEEWSDNLELYIKDWAQKDINRLREMVERNAFSGQRANNLVAEIMHTFEVSRRKAEFLARQETSLLMSKFHESRYRAIGVTKYKWHGTMDERERPDHRRLEGKTFEWTSPPIVNLKTGARGNPGEDFNCRCVAIPIID